MRAKKISNFFVYPKAVFKQGKEVTITKSQAQMLYNLLKNFPEENNNILKHEIKDNEITFYFDEDDNRKLDRDEIKHLKYICMSVLSNEELAKDEPVPLFHPYIVQSNSYVLWYVVAISHYLPLNVCLVSEPGQGKTYLLKTLASLNKTSRYIDINSTPAGVFGEVERTKEGWKWIRALDNNALVYIDEFNLLREDVQNSLLSVLSGVLLINKAGIRVCENIKISSIVAQNPNTSDRRFNRDEDINKQITNNSALLDRIALIYPFEIDIEQFNLNIKQVPFKTLLLDVKLDFDKLRKTEIWDFLRQMWEHYKSLRAIYTTVAIWTFNKLFKVDLDVTKSIAFNFIQVKYMKTPVDLAFDLMNELEDKCKEVYEGKKAFNKFYKKMKGVIS